MADFCLFDEAIFDPAIFDTCESTGGHHGRGKPPRPRKAIHPLPPLLNPDDEDADLALALL